MVQAQREEIRRRQGLYRNGRPLPDLKDRTVLLVDDGVATNTSAAITSTGDWRPIQVDSLILSNNPTRLRVSLDISAGGAVQCYFDRIRLLLITSALREYRMPVGDELIEFLWLSSVELGYAERTGAAEHAMVGFMTPSQMLRPGEDYTIVDREGTKYLNLVPGAASPRRPLVGMNDHSPGSFAMDVPLRLTGAHQRQLMTANSDTARTEALYLTAYAAWYAAVSTPLGNESAEERAQKVRMTKGLWEDALRTVQMRPPSGSMLVNRV